MYFQITSLKVLSLFRFFLTPELSIYTTMLIFSRIGYRYKKYHVGSSDIHDIAQNTFKLLRLCRYAHHLFSKTIIKFLPLNASEENATSIHLVIFEQF